MADYGKNFGFRRTLGDSSVREGRYKVPATGTFHQGDLVTIDEANPGYIRLADAGATFVPGQTGLLIQEFELDSIYAVGDIDSHTRGIAKNGYLCTIWSGAGIKVWLRNTDAENRWDGRVIEARQVAVLDGLTALDDLSWDGTRWIATAVGGTPALRVTVTNGASYAEAISLV